MRLETFDRGRKKAENVMQKWGMRFQEAKIVWEKYLGGHWDVVLSLFNLFGQIMIKGMEKKSFGNSSQFSWCKLEAKVMIVDRYMCRAPKNVEESDKVICWGRFLFEILLNKFSMRQLSILSSGKVTIENWVNAVRAQPDLEIAFW